MLKNYFKSAWRNLLRHKSQSLVNLLSLAVGLACFSLFLLYAVHEFSYDNFHVRKDRIYRVYNWWKNDKSEGIEPASATPLGPALQREFPDVEAYVRIQPHGGQAFVKRDGQTLKIPISFADPQFFSVFTFPLVSGTPAAALTGPRNIVLTQSTARQLFGSDRVAGEPLEIKTGDRYETFVVGGVAADPPANSSIRFSMLANLDYVLQSPRGKPSINDWFMTIGLGVYVLLREDSHLAERPDRLAAFTKKYLPGSETSGFGLQPLPRVHTGTDIDAWGATDPRKIWMLVGISLAVLLIAGINFVLLSIGRAAGRMMEIGVRKTFGAFRGQLISQFLFEAILMSLLAALLGIFLARLLLPLFNELSGQPLTLSVTENPQFAGWLLLTVVLAGLLTGCYPALVLSRISPVLSLKRKGTLSGYNAFTKSLITLQFTISLGLIFATIVFLRQLSFLQTKDLGLRKEQVIALPTRGMETAKLSTLLAEAGSRTGSILGFSASEIGLGEGEGQMGRRYKTGDREETVIEYPVDASFIDVLGVQLLAGRRFNPEIASDSVGALIVNETLVRKFLGTTPAKAIGMTLQEAGHPGPPRTIIGVTRDFHFEDLTRTVRPQVFYYPARINPAVVFVRINPARAAEAVGFLETTWKNAAMEAPFSYSFLDEKFNAFYKAETRWSRVAGLAGGISVFLACLGLYGLLTLLTASRTREIGIRKVLGASTSELVRLFSAQFIRLVLIAFALAAPLAGWLMHRWLTHFAYRIELQGWMFLLAGASGLIVTLLTVSTGTLRAALANPVKNLRVD